MKETELRIGNLVSLNDGGDSVYIKSVADGGCDIYNNVISTWVEFDELSEIKLTEQWLIKFGFHADNYGVYEKVKNNTKYISGCKIEVWIKQCEIKKEIVWDYCIGNDLSNLTHIAFIKYVHKIQNLFYELNNEELTLNTSTHDT
jgi:hypothetical protein